MIVMPAPRMALYQLCGLSTRVSYVTEHDPAVA